MAFFLGIVLLLNFLVWFRPSTSILDYGFADFSVVFEYLPIVVVLLVSSFMMSFAVEDFESGFSSVLFSKPVSTKSYLINFLGACGFVVIMFLALSYLSIIGVNFLKMDGQDIDHIQILASYFGAVLLSLTFSTLCALVASLSSNQASAFLLGLSLCFLLYFGPSLLSEMSIFNGGLDFYLQNIGFQYHFENMKRGILHLNSIAYFVLIIYGCFHCTLLFLEKRLS